LQKKALEEKQKEEREQRKLERERTPSKPPAGGAGAQRSNPENQ
jgi:hypothetical protein